MTAMQEFIALHSCGRNRWNAHRAIEAQGEYERLYRASSFVGFELSGHRYHFASWVSWTMLPQVSLSMAMVEPVTSVGGMVNSPPFPLTRS
jgi:hypothetical protein